MATLLRHLRPAAACLVWALIASPLAAQPFVYNWDGEGGNGLWSTAANWGDPEGQTPNAVPFAYYTEMGTIDNGDTVTINTQQAALDDGAGGQPVDSQGAPGGVVVGGGSSLVITSTGALAVIQNGLTTGDIVINGGGSVTVNSGGQLMPDDNIEVQNGALTLMTGAQANAQNVFSNADGAITLEGTAQLSSVQHSTLAGQLRIVGPSVNFTAPSLTLQGGSDFNPVITGATHSAITTPGTIAVAGALRPEFQGVSPEIGDTWVVFDAGEINGNFDAWDDTDTPLDEGLRYSLVTTSEGSANGVRGLVTVEQNLSLEVNRRTGMVTLRNAASVGDGVTMSGYNITSASGSLVPGGFTSGLSDDGVDDGAWQKSPGSPNGLAELNPLGESVIATGASNPLGEFYDAISTVTEFAAPVPEDLQLSFRTSDGRVLEGDVNYVDDGPANTLLLQVDPTDGKARIVNDSPFDDIEMDGYRVLSDSGSLNTDWESLEDQGQTDWQETGGTSSNVLSELNGFGALSIDSGRTAAVFAGMYDFESGVPDLTFEFRSPGRGVLDGVVRFEPFALGMTGDYNDDGVIDAADYALWRDNLGNPGAVLANRDPGASGPVGAADYQAWRDNYGATAATPAVAAPEPSASLLVLLGAACASAFPRRSFR